LKEILESNVFQPQALLSEWLSRSIYPRRPWRFAQTVAAVFEGCDISRKKPRATAKLTSSQEGREVSTSGKDPLLDTASARAWPALAFVN
jgi:hypothetical protein